MNMLSRRQHMLLAGIIWFGVGMMLLIRGFIWLFTDSQLNWRYLLGLPLVILAGGLKGRMVLLHTADGIIRHIEHLDRRSPFWKVYAVKIYLMIAGMIGLGILCR